MLLIDFWAQKNIYREPKILQLLIIFTRCLEEWLIIEVSMKIISFACKSKGLGQITADPNKTLAIFWPIHCTEVRLSSIYKTVCPYFLHPRQLRVLDGGVDLHVAHPTTYRHVSHDKFRGSNGHLSKNTNIFLETRPNNPLHWSTGPASM